MFYKKDMESNYKVIREVCKRFRKEFTIFGGLVGNEIELVDVKDYIEFMNQLTFDEFVGNYFSDLLRDCNIEIYKQFLSDELSFEDHASQYIDIEEFHKLMEEF